MQQKSKFLGKRLPRRDCGKCEGTGFIMGNVNGKRMALGKCDCWRWVDFKKSERSGEVVVDGKLAGAGHDN